MAAMMQTCWVGEKKTNKYIKKFTENTLDMKENQAFACMTPDQVEFVIHYYYLCCLTITNTGHQNLSLPFHTKLNFLLYFTFFWSYETINNLYYCINYWILGFTCTRMVNGSIQKGFDVICKNMFVCLVFLNRSHRGIVSNFLNGTFVQYSYLDFQPLELVAVPFHWSKLLIIIIMNHDNWRFLKLNRGVFVD